VKVPPRIAREPYAGYSEHTWATHDARKRASAPWLRVKVPPRIVREPLADYPEHTWATHDARKRASAPWLIVKVPPRIVREARGTQSFEQPAVVLFPCRHVL